jgi:O-antigen/teichoic acid export membrane protein
LKRRFIENLLFFLTLNLLIKPIYVFGIDRVVQNTVGTEVYGSYFPLLNLVLIFQIFLDLGIESFTRKEIAHNPGLTQRLFSRFLLIKIILLILFVVAFSIVGLILPHTATEFKILFLLLINQAMANFILYLRANIGGMQLFKTESIISVIDRFFMIVFVGLLLILPATKANFKIEWFVFSQTIAYFITLVISLIIILSRTGKIRFKLNFTAYLPILRQLWPYAVLTLLMAFYNRIDSVFLRYMLPDGSEQAGIYAHGYRLLDFMSNYALIFAIILLPMFSKMLRNKENISSLLRLSVISLIIPSIAFLVSVIFYRKDVFALLYHEHSTISADTFIFFAISFIGICISYTFGALLTANGNLRQLNIMAASAAVISTVSNLILIPEYKVLGAAAANAITQVYTIFFHILVAKRKFKLRFDNILVIKIIAFNAFSICCGYYISTTQIKWVTGIILITGFSFLFAVAIRLFSVSFLSVLFKSKDAVQ